MIVDKTESMGEHAWTKLLDDKESTDTGAVIVNMSNKTGVQNCKATSALSDEMVDAAATTTQAAARKVSSGDLLPLDMGRDEATECLTKFNRNNNGEEKSVSMQRKESILGTFHRHLRRSIKAVSESPGPITRSNSIMEWIRSQHSSKEQIICYDDSGVARCIGGNETTLWQWDKKYLKHRLVFLAKEKAL